MRLRLLPYFHRVSINDRWKGPFNLGALWIDSACGLSRVINIELFVSR